jgi:hypothetical protein
MSDLRLYIASRKNRDAEFAENYEKGYQEFKLGVIGGGSAAPTTPVTNRRPSSRLLLI